MHVVYAREEAPQTYSKSIFLAGPSPRYRDTPNWREDALKILEEEGYDGVVFLPLPRDGSWSKDYHGQVDWERKNLDRADALLFWIPRDMQTLPALTTNIEFGTWYNSGRTILGYPLDAPHMRYLAHVGKNVGVPISHTLRETVQNTIRMIGEGASRSGGERDIPLIIWNTPEFQQWYASLRSAGNRLDGAKIEWLFRVGPMKSKVFMYALHVDVHISAEGRNKANEIVIFRPDISAIIAYEIERSRDFMDTRVVLIREFRSPVNNGTSWVYELPGGSSPKPGARPETIAAEEFAEETGCALDPERFHFVGVHQVAATLSAHRTHLFSVRLTPEEMDWFVAQQQEGTPHGDLEGTERTYIEVFTLREMIDRKIVDWSMIGMISKALLA